MSRFFVVGNIWGHNTDYKSTKLFSTTAIDVGREEVAEHWYDQLFLVSHDVAFTEVTDKVIEL